MPKTIPIFYSAMLLTLVNLLLRFAGTSFQVYISSALGAAGVGLLQLTMSVGSLAMIAGIAGVRTAAMYLTAGALGRGKPQNVTWVLSGCFCYSICISSVIAAALYVFAPFIAQCWIGDLRTVSALRLFAAFLPAACLCAVMTGYFTAANRIGTLAMVEVAEQLCSMLLTLILLHFWGRRDVGRACLCVVFGSSMGCVLTLACLVFLRLRERPPRGPRIRVARNLADTALPLALADVLKAGISTTENLMVPKRLALFPAATDPLAAFGIISGMVFPVLMFPACILYSLAELLIPELARCAAAGSQKRIAYLVRRCLKAAMVYGFLFSGLMFLLSEPLCLSLYDNPEAGQQLRRYSLLIPMLYCDTITDAMTKGLGQQKVCVRYNIVTSSMDVAFLFLLLPGYGMDGYFFSFLITHLINFLLSLKRLLKISCVTLPFYVPTYGISGFLASLWCASLLASPAAGCIVYPLLLISCFSLLRILEAEDRRWLTSLITGQK